MQHPVIRFLCGAALLACAGGALAQDGPATRYGEVGGMNAGNAQACGATPAQVARLRGSHKASIAKVFGTEPGFDKAYDAAAATSEQRVVQAWKQGQYKPPAETCAELMRQVQS